MRLPRAIFMVLCLAIAAPAFTADAKSNAAAANTAAVALITGSDRGLGFALTQELTARGWCVIATCRSPEKATELRCEGRPNSLQINWEGNRFHLTSLTSAICIDDAAIEPDPPGASFDTYIGTGVGRYNGDAGYCASWIFTDAGEPGRPDTATIEISDCGDTVIMQVSGPLTFGNHQAHSN